MTPSWKGGLLMRRRVRGKHAWQSHVRLQADQLATVWREYGLTHAEALRNLLVEHYLPLATATSKKFSACLPARVDVDEVISAGVAGLTAAVEAFDLTRGVRFETYCHLRIRGAIRDALRQADWLPRVLRVRLRRWDAARGQLQAQLGRPPETAEVAGALGLSAAACEALARHAQTACVASLDDLRSGGDRGRPSPLVSLIADERTEYAAGRPQAADLKRLITRGCTRNERLILVLYYYEQLSLKEIGYVLGLSESRVSQLHSSLLERLRSALAGRVQEFLPLEN
jgi:RNA polymerase sigma factor for flagellar operon FliA